MASHQMGMEGIPCIRMIGRTHNKSKQRPRGWFSPFVGYRGVDGAGHRGAAQVQRRTGVDGVAMVRVVRAFSVAWISGALRRRRSAKDAGISIHSSTIWEKTVTSCAAATGSNAGVVLLRAL